MTIDVHIMVGSLEGGRVEFDAVRTHREHQGYRRHQCGACSPHEVLKADVVVGADGPYGVTRKTLMEEDHPKTPMGFMMYE